MGMTRSVSSRGIGPGCVWARWMAWVPAAGGQDLACESNSCCCSELSDRPRSALIGKFPDREVPTDLTMLRQVLEGGDTGP